MNRSSPVTQVTTGAARSDPVVTLVTANATADDLGDQDYAEILSELRANRSLDAFCAMLNSQYSKAWWSRVERGDLALTRAARSELRRAVGLPPLPPTIAEAVQGVDPDAEVVRVQNGEVISAHRVVLLATRQEVTLRCGERVEVLTDAPDETADDCAAPPVRPRTTPYTSLSVPTGTFTRLRALRLALGVSWGEMLDRLLDAQDMQDAQKARREP